MAVRLSACFSITIFTCNPSESTKVYFSFFAEVRDFFCARNLKVSRLKLLPLC